MWVYSFLLWNEAPRLSMPAFRSVKEAKRVTNQEMLIDDYFMKTELLFKVAGLESKKAPDVH